MKLLLEYGADVSVVDSEGSTPLHGAASKGHVHVVSFLVKQGMCLRSILSTFLIFAHCATSGIDVNSRERRGWSALYHSAYFGKTEVASLLLQSSADGNVADFRGVTPLHGAAMCGHTAAIELLLTYGARIDARDREGRTPLHEGSETCRLLLVISHSVLSSGS